MWLVEAKKLLRIHRKKLLKKHKYPPEGMDDAVQTVMTQCELWTDNQDITDIQYEHEPDMPMAAEGKAAYSAI